MTVLAPLLPVVINIAQVIDDAAMLLNVPLEVLQAPGTIEVALSG